LDEEHSSLIFSSCSEIGTLAITNVNRSAATFILLEIGVVFSIPNRWVQYKQSPSVNNLYDMESS
jgi:hypothetical protein